jgi:hypothetical protein
MAATLVVPVELKPLLTAGWCRGSTLDFYSEDAQLILGQDTVYPEYSFLRFQSFQANTGIVP